MSSIEMQGLAIPAKRTVSQMIAMPVNVRVLRSVPEIEQMRDAWMQMQRHPNADIDFYLTVLPSLPGLIRPHVVVIQCHATPVAMLVGRLEHARMHFKMGYAEVWRPRARTLTFIYGGLLGDPNSENCEILVREVMRSLREREADMVFFNHLRADSLFYGALRRLPGLISRDYLPALQIHRKMTIPGSAEEFWQRLSPKVRKNQQWQAKKLLGAHSGNVRIERFREGRELDRLVQDVEYVAAKTYQRGLGVGFADSVEMRKRLHLKAEKGYLRGYVLYLDNQPCAFWLGTVYDHDFHSDYMGYDPSYGKYSPGMYLMTNVIQGFCKRNGGEGDIRAIDFGLGDAQYKEVLGNVQWEDASFYLFGPTVRGRTLQTVRMPMLLIDRLARKVTGQSHVFPKIRRLWRRWTAPSVNTRSSGVHLQNRAGGSPQS